MPLVEIPLWVSHGTTTKKKSLLPPLTQDDTPPTSNEAAVAFSLLPTKQSQRPPMYAVDIHPDGQRFATGSGDGIVKIWSLNCLFDGRFDSTTHTNTNKNTTHKKKMGAKKCRMGEFQEGGNYISSNSEGEGYYDTSENEESFVGGEKRQLQQTQPQQQQSMPIQGVNDLSGLVRRKKGGGAAIRLENRSMETAGAEMIMSHATTEPKLADSNNEFANSSTSPSSQRLNHSNTNDTTSTPPKTKHKLLTTISSSHTGSILSLRFSPSGQYLATAGDDSYINIYTRSKTPVYKGNLVNVDSNGNNTQNNDDVEYWNRIAVGRGHALDVVGLAWAPDDSHLVSCSLDSVHPVIVWRLFDVLESSSTSTTTTTATTIHNLHPFKVLGRNSHTSTVKGVAFDPAGKYIATSGDDPAICIWRAFDDWGLESRIDSNSGVFRSRKRKRKGAVGEKDEEDMEDPGELASLSLFRRISFAPDGSHVCGTNASLRGKNIAAMISREGWAASVPGTEGTKNAVPGAANLVGHKQPVVSSRHCPVFFDSQKDGEESDEDAEPEYAMLVALGDKKGFVTVWSTKMSRPLFKMQCSESRCTVTDISWGFVSGKNCADGKDSLVMIVSLLDGYVVAINFTIPDEVGGGSVLSASKQSQIFRLKYGIEDFGVYGFSPAKRRGVKRLVDDAGPMLIENALQLTMEMENDASENIEATTTKGGKKRGRPPGATNVSDEEAGDGEKKGKKKSTAQDPLQNALDAAARANDAAAKAAGQKTAADGSSTTEPTNQASTPAGRQTPTASGPIFTIPYVTNKIYSVELPSKSSPVSASATLDDTQPKLVADVVNSHTTPGCMPSATLTISRGGVIEWKDFLAQVSCTSLAVDTSLLAVGTADGCLLVYGTSPTLGWDSAKAFRAFPSFVFGSAVINISFSTCKGETKVVVVTSDGQFRVYNFLPLGPKLEFKGSITPPMQHLMLSCTTGANNSALQPKLARIQITESHHLMLILSFGTITAKSLHGFIYNRDMEVWMKVSDSNSFLMSNLYPSIPGMPAEEEGLLSKMDQLVRSGASMESAKQMYIKLAGNEKQKSQIIITRAHCEDRLACAMALRSASDFQVWISSYAKCLSSSGNADTLRFLVDVLLGNADDVETADNPPTPHSCWWFNSITNSSCLGLNHKDIIRNKILPEMIKNRHLQRLTNEISMELDS